MSQEWINKGLCRYVNDKKITDWRAIARVQFPIEVLQSDNRNILTKTNLVKSLELYHFPKTEGRLA